MISVSFCSVVIGSKIICVNVYSAAQCDSLHASFVADFIVFVFRNV